MVDTGIISAGANYAAPVIPFFLGLVVAIQRFYLRSSRQLRILELDASKWLTRQFTETAAGIEHIRSFQWQDRLVGEFHNVLNLTQRPRYLLLCIQQWLECVLDFSTVGAATIVVTVALESRGSSSGNAMGLAFLSLITFSDTVSSWIRHSVALETTSGALYRIRKFEADVPREEYNDRGEVPADWPSEGKLELNSVTAMYR